MGRRRYAFTLVELLVVIGIIAVLIGILMPALNAARRASLKTQCLSNMRQLGQAEFMYAAEYKGALATGRVGDPGAVAYGGQIKNGQLYAGLTALPQAPLILIEGKYLPVEVFYCPGRDPIDRYGYDNPNVGWNAFNGPYQWREISYVIGQSMNGTPIGLKNYAKWYKMGKASGDLVFAYEVCYEDGLFEGGRAPFGFNKTGHGRGYNMAFCDGSARWVDDSADILQKIWVLKFFSEPPGDFGHHEIMTKLLGWSEARYNKYCPAS